MPILAGCPSWFAGRIVERLALGDHVGFVLEPVEAGGGDAPALGFQAARGIEPGHEA